MHESIPEILCEYGPFPGVKNVAGVAFDGDAVWFASGDAMRAFDPGSGEEMVAIDVPAHAGTAFDGQFLYQIADARIQRVDPKTRSVVSSIPAPCGADTAGLAWAEGTLWVGAYSGRKIHEVDPASGVILRTIDSNRFVTGVTWFQGELWHATSEDDESELRRLEPHSGEVIERMRMPKGVKISGLDSNGKDRFFCGGGGSGTVRAVRRPARAT